MSSAPANHDPALAINGQNSASIPEPQGSGNTEGGASQFNNLDQQQIMNLLRSIPGFPKGLGDAKDSDAAQTLSNLSQQANFAHPLPHSLAQAQAQHSAAPQGNPFAHNEPGPSSHPRGPPNLGQLSAIASQSPPLSSTRAQTMGQQEREEGASDADGGDGENKEQSDGTQPASAGGSGTKRTGRSATMGSEEWTRQRKDNHKEVERRRRGNINDGINELGRIVPNGSGEKAKGAILSRAVQYIHHLKENEARNIEKWTLEKLLMDQAMGDLQAQLEEMRRLWEEERLARQRLESELEVLRGGASKASNVRSRSPADGATGHVEEAEEERGTKRQRVE